MAIELNGLVIPFSRRHVLLYGPDAAAFGTPLFGPPVFLRPGYKLVWENDYLLPEQAIDDRGQRYDGAQAAEWIETQGYSYPRADAIGFRPSGESLGLEMKELDLAVLALFASAHATGPAVKLAIAIEALAVPDGYALSPVAPPLELALYARTLPFYRLAPGAFGAAGAALVNRLLSTGQTDWRVTFDDLDDTLDR
jgi:hypothetical protein